MPGTIPNPTYTSFIGTGWSFPPRFENGTLLMTSDEADINASLQILLGTTVGERFLQPKYGLNLRGLIFEPMSTTMLTTLKDEAKLAILIYEPRINLLSLDLDTSTQVEGRISIVIEYEIRATNSRYNLVYPFYTSDSNEVRPTT